MAVADPSGTVQERYLYTVDGLPQAVSVNWTARTVGGVLQYASTLGWNWLYRGEQWVQTQPDTLLTQWRRIYVSTAGVWYDPVHGRTFQPNLSAYGDPQTNPYQMTAWEKFGATAAPVILGIGVTLATGGLVAPIAAVLGGAVICGLSSYAAGSDASQIAAGRCHWRNRRRGQVARQANLRVLARPLGESLGLTCENGLGMAGGLLMGAAEGAAFGATRKVCPHGLDDRQRHGRRDGRLERRIDGRGHRRAAGRDLPRSLFYRRHAGSQANRRKYGVGGACRQAVLDVGHACDCPLAWR